MIMFHHYNHWGYFGYLYSVSTCWIDGRRVLLPRSSNSSCSYSAGVWTHPSHFFGQYER